MKVKVSGKADFFYFEHMPPEGLGFYFNVDFQMVIEEEMVRIFRAAPAACLVLLPNVPNFTIVEVSDAYLKAKSLKRTDLVGKKLFDIFPDVPSYDNLSDFTYSLLYVLENKKPHRMAIQKTEVSRRMFKEQYWLPENIPVLDDKNEITHIIYSLQDVTHRLAAEKSSDFSKQLLSKTEAIGRTYSWQWNITTNKIRVSEGLYKLLGMTAASIQMTGEFVHSMVDDNDKDQFRLVCHHLRAHPVKFEFQFRIKTLNGEVRTFHVKGEPQANGSADPAMLGHVIDVTERTELEESLKESEKLFRNAFEYSPIGMALVNSGLAYKKTNRSFCQILGYAEDEMLERKVTDVTHPDDIPANLRCFDEVLSGKIKSRHMEKRYLHKNGETIWASVSISTVTDSAGRFMYFVVQVENITERRRVDLALQKSEQEYKSLFEQSSDPIFSVNADGKFLSANRSALQLFMQTDSGRPDRYFYDFCNVEDHLMISGIFEEAQNRKGSGFEVTIRTGMSQGTLLNITTVPIIVDGNVHGIYCIAKNITDKRRLEKAVQMERQRFSDMFTVAPVGMCIVKGEDLVMDSANDEYFKLSGRSADILGKRLRDIFPEAEGQGIFELMTGVYRTGETYTAVEQLVQIDINQDGQKEDLYLNFMFMPYRDSDGQVEGIFFFGVDVTLEVLARKKIEEREKQYYDVIQTMPAAVFTTDVNGNLLIFNKAAVSLWGSGPVRGKFWRNSWEIYTTSGLPVIDEDSPVTRTLEEQRPLQCPENLILRPDGQTRHVLPFPSPLFDGDGNATGVICVMIDITERKKAEEELKKLSVIAKRTTNAIVITDPAGYIEWVNEAFTSITEFQFHEVIGKRTSEVLHGRDTDPATQDFIKSQMEKMLAFECEMLKYKKSGDPFWVEIQGQPLFDEDGQLTHYFEIETEITERKIAFQELIKKENEIRTFAKQLNDVLEDERSRIAREIHDEFGQQLTGLKMSLSVLQGQKGLDRQLKQTVQDMMAGIENTIQSLRKFATELRPGILDTLGMIPSIEWLVREFEKKTGIPCRLRIKVQQSTFEKSVSTAYFRICQEALTNIARHAEATKVMIEISQVDGRLSLIVADNGKGIAAGKMNHAYSMGLLGMRERAKLIGADLAINSQQDAGTSIKITVKLDDA
jgi:PAS domain S-box-containing protein